MSCNDARSCLRNLRVERDNAALYARLAAVASDPRLAQVYQRIAEGERANAAFWESRLGALGVAVPAPHPRVRVRVLVPGEHIDSETVRLASKASWGPLLEQGVEIHEYLPTMMHNKLLIVDRELVSVGSTNFDSRSFRLNDEASLNVYDKGFAAKMTGVFEEDLKHARPYTHQDWLNRPLKEKLIERFVLPIKSQL